MQVHAVATEVDCKPTRVRVLVEAYTDGTDRRAHAQAWAIEIAPDRLEVVPFCLREVAGPDVRWYAPAHGKPILTVNPIRTRQEAENVLALWAMSTFAENARAAIAQHDVIGVCAQEAKSATEGGERQAFVDRQMTGLLRALDFHLPNVMDKITVIAALIIIVVAMVFIVASGIGAALVAGWRIIALTLEAIVHVPLAIALFFIGIVAVLTLRDVFGCVIAGVCLYSGGNLLFGVIDGYVKSSRPSKHDR